MGQLVRDGAPTSDLSPDEDVGRRDVSLGSPCAERSSEARRGVIAHPAIRPYRRPDRLDIASVVGEPPDARPRRRGPGTRRYAGRAAEVELADRQRDKDGGIAAHLETVFFFFFFFVDGRTLGSRELVSTHTARSRSATRIVASTSPIAGRILEWDQ